DWSDSSTQQLQQGLAQLDERSRDILYQRWLAEEKATLHELAAKYQVSAERIRQLEANAMTKLKKHIDVVDAACSGRKGSWGVRWDAPLLLAKRNCTNPRLALRVGTLLAAIVLTILALDQWWQEREATQPLSWQPEYQASLWAPLRNGSLT